MTSFPLDSAGYTYRPLKKGQQGWDIYALQSALKGAGFYTTYAVDGYAGAITDKAIRDYQAASGLTVDGIAGIVTQRSLALRDMYAANVKYKLPQGALKGQIESESGYILGNHSPRYENGSFDVGVTQRNTAYVSLDTGFDAPDSLDFLGAHIRRKYNEYKSYGVITSERRLWELAQGSWNRPAWTDRLAKGLSLTQSQSTWIEGYIDRVSAYLVV